MFSLITLYLPAALLKKNCDKYSTINDKKNFLTPLLNIFVKLFTRYI